MHATRRACAKMIVAGFDGTGLSDHTRKLIVNGIGAAVLFTRNVESARQVGALCSEIKRVAIEEGMITLRESGLAKIRAGLTTVREINKVTFVE